WAKLKVKNAVNFIGAFERELAAEARRRGADGVICGHIHHAALREIDGVTYVNTGDFVESCTVAVEREDGGIEILCWAKAARNAAPNGDETADAEAKAAA